MCWRICILITQTPKDKFRKYICCAVAKKERNWFYIQIFIGNACSSDAAYLQQGKIKIACDVKSSVKTECVYVCRSVVQIAARHRGQISNQDREKSSTYSLIKEKYRLYLSKSQRYVPKILLIIFFSKTVNLGSTHLVKRILVENYISFSIPSIK